MQHHDEEQVLDFSFKNFFVPFTTVKAITWIVIIGFLVYANGFVNLFLGDDLGQIVDNVYVHSFLHIQTFFSSSTFYNGGSQDLIGNYFRPLLSTYFSSIYTFFGPNYFIFHLLQLLLHLLNTTFLFLFLKRIFRISIAFTLSLVFLIHPINSETVLYISDSQEVLFLFFGILSMWSLQKYMARKGLIIASICLLFSLLSKETGLLFVLIALIYIFLFQKKRIIHALIAGTTVFIIYLLLRMHAIGSFSFPSNSSIATLSLFERLLNIPEMFLFYLKTFFFPYDLSSSWQWTYRKIDFAHFYLPLACDLLFLLVIFFFALFIYKKTSKKYFLIFVFFTIWLLTGIFFHMQVFPLDATVGERWFYFPIIGILGMAGVLLEIVQIKLKNKWIVSVIVVIVLMLSIRTFIRTFDWRDTVALASHDLRVSREAYGLENMLSYYYFNNGEFEKAKIHAENSIRLHPFMTNYLNLGASYFALHDYANAKNAFLQSLIYGDSYQTYENLAFLALSYGEPQENIRFIQETALHKFPFDGKLWLYLAILAYNHEDKEKARVAIQHAYQYNPSMQVVGVYNAIMNNKPVTFSNSK